MPDNSDNDMSSTKPVPRLSQAFCQIPCLPPPAPASFPNHPLKDSTFQLPQFAPTPAERRDGIASLGRCCSCECTLHAMVWRAFPRMCIPCSKAARSQQVLVQRPPPHHDRHSRQGNSHGCGFQFIQGLRQMHLQYTLPYRDCLFDWQQPDCEHQIENILVLYTHIYIYITSFV